MAKRTTAGDIMTKPAITADITNGVGDIATLMANNRVGSVIITENDLARGIITERDIVNAVGLHKREFFDLKAKDIMARPLFSAIPSMDIEKLEKEMRRRKIKHLPIIAQNKILGMVTSRNVIEHLGKWKAN
ncbi:MAG: hypothetical protein CVU81_02755 [Euryarchaeota archaeon HGW-Euryarchaeota-1]|nr:MAG: hypothetical protein CVU81_02755 [Euryarchaeota archaeon HGW-Euryarchaeota-1]